MVAQGHGGIWWVEWVLQERKHNPARVHVHDVRAGVPWKVGGGTFGASGDLVLVLAHGRVERGLPHGDVGWAPLVSGSREYHDGASRGTG